MKLFFYLLFLLLNSCVMLFSVEIHNKTHSEPTENLNNINQKISGSMPQMNMDHKNSSGMHDMHDGNMMDHMMHMHGMLGRYPQKREASGTSWVPASSPMEGFSIMKNKWMLMLQGFQNFVLDVQRGPRGDRKIFDGNMFMFMAQRDFERHTLSFRSMLSAEPITIGKCGYPLLLQTGETCDGKTELIDRQHPHDLFMELALVYSYLLKKETSVFLYFGLPGEPALGPPVYIMRFSSEYIPETPISHHWMDSTHISFGVLTAGFIYKDLKIELCTFKGREPNQHRFDIEAPKLDSYSFRVTLNPTENLSLQASYGFIKSPEQLHPEVNIKRYILNAIYNKSFDDNNFQAAAILGINDNLPGNFLPAFLLEATLKMHQRHVFFGRFETVNKDDLFAKPDPLANKIFNVKKLTLGYIYEFLNYGNFQWGIGGLIDFPIVPKALENVYKNDTSFMIFLQTRLITF